MITTQQLQDAAQELSLLDQSVDPIEAADRALVVTLPEAGLDRMTRCGIESALCSSALTAHI